MNKYIKQDDQRRLYSSVLDVAKALPAVLDHSYPVTISVVNGYTVTVKLALESSQIQALLNEVRSDQEHALEAIYEDDHKVAAEEEILAEFLAYDIE